MRLYPEPASAGAVAGVSDQITVVDSLHDVPAADAIVNAFLRDVVGNKGDVASEGLGTASLIALIRQLDAQQNVPGANATANALIRDVLGNKLDVAGEAAGTSSLIALLRQALAEVTVVDGLHDVPTADAATNAQMRDVLGNKTDAATRTAATASLMGVLRKVLAEASDIDRHIHNVELWFGPAAVASGQDHIADLLGEVGGTPSGVITSFRVTSGANKTWGTALQVWGATDHTLMPTTKQAYQDVHRLRVTAAETDKHEWLLRLIVGASAAAGVTARTYGIIPLFVENTNKVLTPVEIITERAPAGSKVWAQLLHISDNDAEYCDIQFGVHGYPD